MTRALLLFFTIVASKSLIASDSLASFDTTTTVPPVNIRLESNISSDSIHLDDTLTCTVKIIIEGDPNQYEIADFLPTTTNMKLVGSGSSNRSEAGGGVTLAIREYIFKYAPQTIGMAYIDPVRVTYTYRPTSTQGDLQSSRFSITVLEPHKRRASLPWYAWLIAGLILLGGAVAFVIVYKKKQRRTEEIVPETPPVEEILLEELKEAENARRVGDYSKFFAQLERILARYLSEKHSLDIKGLSREEIQQALIELDYPERIVKGITETLRASEIVRFGKGSVSEEELESSILTLRALLEKPREAKFEPDTENA